MHLGARYRVKLDQIKDIYEYGSQSFLPNRHDDGKDPTRNGSGKNNLKGRGRPSQTAYRRNQFDIPGAHGVKQEENQKDTSADKSAG
jgi:hypothetical protein